VGLDAEFPARIGPASARHTAPAASMRIRKRFMEDSFLDVPRDVGNPWSRLAAKVPGPRPFYQVQRKRGPPGDSLRRRILLQRTEATSTMDRTLPETGF
jgi:hypothetical protein